MVYTFSTKTDIRGENLTSKDGPCAERAMS